MRASRQMCGLTVCTLLVVVVAAAGCGGSSSSASAEAGKPPAQVVADAVQAAEEASSVHMSGQVVEARQKIGVDLSIVPGKGATGSMTLHRANVDLDVVGKRLYMRAGLAFWQQYGHAAGVAELLADKWLELPAGNGQFGHISTLTDVKGLFNQLRDHNGKLVNHGATTFDGQSVVAVYDSPENGTLYVAASGPPYPVGIVKTSRSSTGGHVTFDRWNRPVTLKAPKGALDLSHLGSG